jgi:hypothetical protein
VLFVGEGGLEMSKTVVDGKLEKVEGKLEKEKRY